MVKKCFCLVAGQKAHEILINDANKILPVPTINYENVGDGTGMG